MTAPDAQDELDAQFAQWREYVQGRRALEQPDVEELEDHLRGSVDELMALGLRADEAFLVAVKRMGSLDDLSREFAREHSERLWKQLVLTGETRSPATDTRSRRDLLAMLICAAGAVLSVKVPALFGLTMDDDGPFYARNFGLFALPWLAAFLAWRRQARPVLVGVLVALFALGAVAANVYPLGTDSQSLVLTAIHLPIALWFVVGLSYVSDDIRSSRRRMDFVRFTGEWFVYFVLIGLGGGVLIAFMLGTFEAIGIRAQTFIAEWLLPCGVVAGLHLPIALWLVVGLAYVADDLRSSRRRMDFIRFTGEWFVYFVLMGLGGGVLMAFTYGTFNAIGVDPEEFVSQWVMPCGVMATVVVAGWLVEAKQSVVENIAPVLTRLFTPLFTAVLLAFLIAVGVTSSRIDVEREALILFDLLLVVVLGLLLYSISARDPFAPPGGFDKLQLALVLSALAIDFLVLIEITGRVTEFGTTPNKAAALGENVILLVNLAGSALLLLRFIRRQGRFAVLERWQTRHLPVYAAWAWFVVLAFPPLFSFA